MYNVKEDRYLSYRGIKDECKTLLSFDSIENITSEGDFISPFFVHIIGGKTFLPFCFINKNEITKNSGLINITFNYLALELMKSVDLDIQTLTDIGTDKLQEYLENKIITSKNTSRFEIIEKQTYFDIKYVDASLTYKLLLIYDRKKNIKLNHLFKSQGCVNDIKNNSILFNTYDELLQTLTGNHFAKLSYDKENMLTFSLYMILKNILEKENVLFITTKQNKEYLSKIINSYVSANFICDYNNLENLNNKKEELNFQDYNDYHFTKLRYVSFCQSKDDAYLMPNLFSAKESIQLLKMYSNSELFAIPLDINSYTKSMYEKDVTSLNALVTFDESVEKNIKNNPFYQCVSKGSREEYDLILLATKGIVKHLSRVEKAMENQKYFSFDYKKKSYNEIKEALTFFMMCIEYKQIPVQTQQIQENKDKDIDKLISLYLKVDEAKNNLLQFFNNNIFELDLVSTNKSLSTLFEKVQNKVKNQLRSYLKNKSDEYLIPALTSLDTYATLLEQLEEMQNDYHQDYSSLVNSLNGCMQLKKCFTYNNFVLNNQKYVKQISEENTEFFLSINDDKFRENVTNFIDNINIFLTQLDEDLKTFNHYFPQVNIDEIRDMNIDQMSKYFSRRNRNATFEMFSFYHSYADVIDGASKQLNEFLSIANSEKKTTTNPLNSFKISLLLSYLNRARKRFLPYKQDYEDVRSCMLTTLEKKDLLIYQQLNQILSNRENKLKNYEVEELNNLFVQSKNRLLNYGEYSRLLSLVSTKYPLGIIDADKLYTLPENLYDNVVIISSPDLDSTTLLNGYRVAKKILVINPKDNNDLRLMKENSFYITKNIIDHQILKDEVDSALYSDFIKLLPVDFETSDDEILVPYLFINQNIDIIKEIDYVEMERIIFDVKVKYIDTDVLISGAKNE